MIKIKQAVSRSARLQVSIIRCNSNVVNQKPESSLILLKSQREQALAEALAREEEDYLKERNLRRLQVKCRSSMTALNMTPVDIMAQRVEKLQNELNAIKNQQKVELLDKEIEEFLFENIRLPDSETVNMPWLRATQKRSTSNEANASHTVQSTIKKNFKSKYPDLKLTPDYRPYSSQELYLRHLNQLKQFGSFGSELSDIYTPSHDILKPESISDLSIASLMAAGCHLGHAKQLWRPSTQPFVYAEYNGLHLIDLNETLSALKKTAKIMKGVAKKGGVILYVGTTRLQEQRDALEAAAKRSNGYYVSHRWIPGTFTNFTVVTKHCEGVQRLEVDLGDESTGRAFKESENLIIKPDLVVLMNPVDTKFCISECLKLRIPTIGLCDTDMEPSKLTYAIPCNDDSMRASSLVLGVLSKAAEEGVEDRRRQFLSYKNGIKKNSSETSRSL